MGAYSSYSFPNNARLPASTPLTSAASGDVAACCGNVLVPWPVIKSMSAVASASNITCLCLTDSSLLFDLTGVGCQPSDTVKTGRQERVLTGQEILAST